MTVYATVCPKFQGSNLGMEQGVKTADGIGDPFSIVSLGKGTVSWTPRRLFPLVPFFPFSLFSFLWGNATSSFTYLGEYLKTYQPRC